MLKKAPFSPTQPWRTETRLVSGFVLALNSDSTHALSTLHPRARCGRAGSHLNVLRKLYGI